MREPPPPDEIRKATKDVAWEYAAMLAAAVEMTKGSWEGWCSPINHLVQEAFLVHVRNLAEFFGQPRNKGYIYAVDFYAVDFCDGWNPKKFPQGKLIRAINTTLAHMQYSRDRASRSHVHFEGYEHLDGTVKLMRKTWTDFMKCVEPEYRLDIEEWLVKHTASPKQTERWRVPFRELESAFDQGCDKTKP